MKVATLLLVCAACVSPPAIAQDVIQVSVGTEVLRHADGGTVQGCGVRLTGGRPSAAGPSSWFDISFNVYRQSSPIVQAIGYEIPRPQLDAESRPERVAMQRAWLKVEAASGSTRLGENTEVRDSVIYTLTLDEAAALFEGVAHERRFAMGMKRWGQARETVYAGTPTLDDGNRRQLGACLEALVR